MFPLVLMGKYSSADCPKGFIDNTLISNKLNYVTQTSNIVTLYQGSDYFTINSIDPPSSVIYELANSDGGVFSQSPARIAIDSTGKVTIDRQYKCNWVVKIKIIADGANYFTNTFEVKTTCGSGSTTI